MRKWPRAGALQAQGLSSRYCGGSARLLRAVRLSLGREGSLQETSSGCLRTVPRRAHQRELAREDVWGWLGFEKQRGRRTEAASSQVLMSTYGLHPTNVHLAWGAVETLVEALLPRAVVAPPLRI